jgi:hypothetical protein
VASADPGYVVIPLQSCESRAREHFAQQKPPINLLWVAACRGAAVPGAVEGVDTARASEWAAGGAQFVCPAGSVPVTAAEGPRGDVRMAW